jgi:hypothetical protein
MLLDQNPSRSVIAAYPVRVQPAHLEAPTTPAAMRRVTITPHGSAVGDAVEGVVVDAYDFVTRDPNGLMRFLIDGQQGSQSLGQAHPATTKSGLDEMLKAFSANLDRIPGSGDLTTSAVLVTAKLVTILGRAAVGEVSRAEVGFEAAAQAFRLAGSAAESYFGVAHAGRVGEGVALLVKVGQVGYLLREERERELGEFAPIVSP